MQAIWNYIELCFYLKRHEQDKREKNNQPSQRQEEEEDEDDEDVGAGTPPVMEAVKSKEEILEEMGLNIRRLMTGLLLEVNLFAPLCMRSDIK